MWARGELCRGWAGLGDEARGQEVAEWRSSGWGPEAGRARKEIWHVWGREWGDAGRMS